MILSSIKDEQDYLADSKKNPVNYCVTNTRKILQTQSNSSRRLKQLLDQDDKMIDVSKIGGNGTNNKILINQVELSK